MSIPLIKDLTLNTRDMYRWPIQNMIAFTHNNHKIQITGYSCSLSLALAEAWFLVTDSLRPSPLHDLLRWDTRFVIL